MPTTSGNFKGHFKSCDTLIQAERAETHIAAEVAAVAETPEKPPAAASVNAPAVAFTESDAPTGSDMMIWPPDRVRFDRTGPCSKSGHRKHPRPLNAASSGFDLYGQRNLISRR